MDAAIHTDSVEFSIDYEKVVRSIQHEVGQRECSLLETMAGHVCDVVLRDPRVEKVETQVWKFPKSLQGEIRRVAVCLARGHFS
jgi:dihydroneopterin aldolase